MDDWLTGVDRAIAFMEQKQTQPVNYHTLSRFEKFEHLINNTPSLLIFDGFERLLQSTEDLSYGLPYSAAVKEFLMIIGGKLKGSQPRKSKVVLTSRMIPVLDDDLDAGHPNLETKDSPFHRRNQKDVQILGKGNSNPIYQKIAVYAVESITSDDLNEKKQLAEICPLVEGHVYALHLFDWLLDTAGHDVQNLKDILARTPSTQRISRAVRECIERFEDWIKNKQETQLNTQNALNYLQESDEQNPGVVRRFLERIACFMSPVRLDVVTLCWIDASGDQIADCEEVESVCEYLCSQLVSTGLLFGMGEEGEYIDDRVEMVRWALHPIVRSCIFHRFQCGDSSDLPNITLSGYTSGTASVDPGSAEAGMVVTSLLCRLIDYVNHRIETQSKTIYPQIPTEFRRDLGRLCRSAFGVMRSRMETTTATRWCSYADYGRYAAELANLVKRLSTVCHGRQEKDLVWDYADGPSSKEPWIVQHQNGILYPEELAWLYNEIGYTYYCEGYVHFSVTVLEHGHEINKRVEEGETGQFVVQSLLHLAHVHVELGNLDYASEYLDQTADANKSLKSPDYDARIFGYKGLVAHLKGNRIEANRYYKRCWRGIAKNPRARSKFRQHWADLKIAERDLVTAENYINECYSIATEGNYPDLVAYARNSRGRVFRAQGKLKKARQEYEASLSEARRLGIRRLEVDIYAELSRLGLQQGDTEHALSYAMMSMALANEMGLGLRQCFSFITLGLANLQRRQTKLAIAYLQIAYRQATKQGYLFKAADAEAELRKLGAMV